MAGTGHPADILGCTSGAAAVSSSAESSPCGREREQQAQAEAPALNEV